MRLGLYSVVLLLAAVWACDAAAEFRFPMPEFSSDYQHPQTHVPPPNLTNPAVDLAVLAAALSLTSWAALRRRSRREIFLIAVFSIAYFGFYRKGCICSVGSIQNVLNVFIGDGMAVSFVVLGFFFLPLLFALYFGRVFCAAVCPLGAMQEACAVYPAQVPRPVEAVLGLLPYAYLGLTVLSIAMGSGFMICRYDPFVGFFRQGASFNLLIAGGVLLLAGIVIARPYCRFLCPYGVLLRWTSSFSKWHVSITPAECIQCRLCENSCPYGAIRVSMPETPPETRRAGTKRLRWVLLTAPIVIVLSAWAGAMAHGSIARLHPVVRLAERVAAEEQGQFDKRSIESDAFRAGQKPLTELYDEANALKRRFRYGSAWLGAFLGLVVVGKLIRFSVIRKNKDYVPDRGACLSCGRCFAYCPVKNGESDA